jgi:hypothetical protein
MSEEKKNIFQCLKHGPLVKQIKQNVQIFDGVVIWSSKSISKRLKYTVQKVLMFYIDSLHFNDQAIQTIQWTIIILLWFYNIFGG